jgi:protein SCO1/2
MKSLSVLLVFCFIFSCSPKSEKLPLLGNPTIIKNDTIYPIIADFSFINQDSLIITNATFKDKIYVAEFMFLSCPTICPKMHVELSKVNAYFINNPNVLFLSHTIDPERDSVERLKEYSDNNKINSKKWFFVTGVKDSIYNIATKSYYATAYKDEKEPGGYVHSGGFLLVDKNKHIRGVYDGTNPKETNRLIRDIKILLKE